MTALNPVFTVGDQIAEVARIHAGTSKRDAWEKAVEMLTLVGIPAPEQRAERVPAPALRRHAAARHDRDGARHEPRAPDRRRADDRARRHHPGADPRAAARPQQRLGTSILLITHDLGVVAENCSRVVVMYARRGGGGGAGERRCSPRAHHPVHARGCCGAMPRVGGERERLATIPGTVPPPTAWPAGCRFRDRCPYAWERCEREHPPLYQLGEGHVSRCHLAEEPERRAHPHPPLAAQRGCERRMTTPIVERDAIAPGAGDPLLSVRDLTKHFPIKHGVFGRGSGAVRAVDGVSFDVCRGRDARARRRIGVRQDDDRPRDPAPHRADRRAPCASTAQDVLALGAGELRRAAAPDADRLPGSLLLAQPAHDGRRDRARGADDPQARRGRRRRTRG